MSPDIEHQTENQNAQNEFSVLVEKYFDAKQDGDLQSAEENLEKVRDYRQESGLDDSIALSIWEALKARYENAKEDK